MNDYVFNELKISCDWISFTVDSTDLTDSIGLFGFSLEDFRLMDRGAQGYKRMLRHPFYPITVLYDGMPEMGVHMDVKGSAVVFFLKTVKDNYLVDTPFDCQAYAEIDSDFMPDDILPHVFSLILKHGHFTRLDIAIDDFGCHYFSISDLVHLLKQRQFVSKFRTWEHIDKQTTSSGEILGNTVYMGSRQSDVMLRIYDKQLEQLRKKADAGIPWVRWEFELKDLRACVFAGYVVENKTFGILGMKLLTSYLRFIQNDDSNKSRCSSLPLWDKFVGDVGRLRLTLPETEKSVEKSMNWIKRQCLPTIAGLTLAKLGDMTFISENLEEHYRRLCAESRHVFEKYRDEQLKMLASNAVHTGGEPQARMKNGYEIV